MRILHVVTYMGVGGLETMLMNYYRAMDRSRVQFDFLTHRKFKADYDDEILSLGGKLFYLNRLNPFSPSYRHELGKFFDDHPEYQIIHVHQDCMSSVVLKIAKQHGVPVRIAHSHSSSQDKNIKYPMKLFYRYFIPKYATNLMACGDAAGQWMFRGNSFEILNNAIDAAAYVYDPSRRAEIRRELKIPEKALTVGHVGRFSPAKNHEGLLDIFSEIRKRINAVLLLVGEGELRKQMEQKADALGLRDSVIFMGLRTDVNALMQAMDVFVFPSNYEGIPLTMIEAQAAGLPCLISDRVPIECKITDPVKQIPLNASPAIWAQEAIEASKTPRRNTFSEVAKAGYDVKTNARNLTERYIDLERAANGQKGLQRT